MCQPEIHNAGDHQIFTGPNGTPVRMWTHGVDVEEDALRQLKNLSELPFIHKWVAAMPDVHFGKGATIGSVIPTTGAIIPAAVGVDLGCVDEDTEFLTTTGWKKISEWDNDLVAQYDQTTGVATYVQPSAYIKKPADKFYSFKTKYGINQMLSPEHRVLFRGTSRNGVGHGELQVLTAEEIVQKHRENVQGFSGRVLTTFIPAIETSVPLTDTEIRLMLMVMADGSFSKKSPNSHRCQVHFKKPRKYDRAIKLLKEAGIDYVDKTDAFCFRLRFDAPIREKSLAYFWPASLDQLRIISDEVFQWDGTEHLSVFFTRDKKSADFMSYCFAATGRRSRVLTDHRDCGTDYRVFALPNTEIGLKGSPKSEIKEIDGAGSFKYCFVVPTSFWIMRRKGCIAITGNCGMKAVMTTLKSTDLPDNLHGIRSAIEKAVPHGKTPGRDTGSWGRIPQPVMEAWEELSERFNAIVLKYPKLAKTNHITHLGTLGTGNHFIELCLDEHDNVWIMLHSGSRGVGNAIGSFFIEKAKEEMMRWFIHLPDDDLAYLAEGSKYFDDYVEAVHWAQDFARLNRDVMMDAVLGALRTQITKPFNITSVAVNCHHNYVARENHYGRNVWLTRKGAVRAREGDLGIIPGSMGAKSFIVRGKGNPQSFNSCSHGAGRRMSRAEASRRFSVEDHAAATAGVECRKDKDVIDETPMAYKDIDAVMAAQSELVEIVHTLKQVVCVKG